MGIIRRPTMGERMDNAAERRRPWWVTAEIREIARDTNKRFRRADRRYRNTEPYRGSSDEREHQRRGRRS